MSTRINPDACGVIETAMKLADDAMNGYGAVTVELAKQMVMQHGIDALQTISGVVELKKRYIAEVEKQKNPIIAVSAYHDAIDLACSWATAEMANKAQVLACLMLPFGFITEEDSEDEADICPFCGKPVTYDGETDIDADNAVAYGEWHCDECGAHGKNSGEIIVVGANEVEVCFTEYVELYNEDGKKVDATAFEFNVQVAGAVLDENICPCCGGELEYEGDEHMDYEAGDGATEASWTCPHCGATGKALGQVQFTGFYGVCDKDGNAVEVA